MPPTQHLGSHRKPQGARACCTEAGRARACAVLLWGLVLD